MVDAVNSLLLAKKQYGNAEKNINKESNITNTSKFERVPHSDSVNFKGSTKDEIVEALEEYKKREEKKEFKGLLIALASIPVFMLLAKKFL